jgi:uncharacterized protein
VFVVDTNLLIYAATAQSAPHRQAERLVSEWRASSDMWRITWSIAYEFMRVVTHPSVLVRPLTFAEAWSFIACLGASPSFGFLVETERHAEAIRDLTREYPRISGNRLHDLHIAALMREHGVAEIRTADVGFHQFKFLRVVNPL